MKYNKRTTICRSCCAIFNDLSELHIYGFRNDPLSIDFSCPKCGFNSIHFMYCKDVVFGDVELKGED